MYLTTQKLIQYLYTHPEREFIIQGLQVIDSLYRRYGERLRLSSIQKKIQTNYPNIYMLIHLLMQYNTLGKEKTLLQGMYKRAEKDISPMVIQSHGLKEKHTTLLQEKTSSLSANKEYKNYHKNGIRLEKNGKYYERNIQKDIDRLLK